MASSTPLVAMDVRSIPTMIAYSSHSHQSSSSHQQQQPQHHDSSLYLNDSTSMMDCDCGVSTSSYRLPFESSSSSLSFHKMMMSSSSDHLPPPATVTTLSPSATAAIRQKSSLSSSSPSSSSSSPTPSFSTCSSSGNVRVTVAGESFSFPQSAFASYFAGLPWRCDMDGVYHLNGSCSPAVFEVLLDYTLFGTLPAYDTLCQSEFEEFEMMALAMGESFRALIEHFDRKDSYWNRELRQSSTPRSRKAILLNPSSSPLLLSSPNGVKCARFLGALCGVAETILPKRRRPAEQEAAVKRLKLSHNTATTKRGRWSPY